MTRAQIVIFALFLALVGGGALVLGPRLSRRPRSSEAPVAREFSGGGPIPIDWEALKEPEAPASPTLTIEVVGADGKAIDPTMLRLVGATLAESSPALRVRWTAPVAWVTAPDCAWAKVSDTADREAIRLVRAAPPFALKVTEGDGSPAVGVRVAWTPYGPDSGEGRTGADGVVTITGRAPGLVTIRVGGRERAGPSMRVVLGTDMRADAVLDPAWVVTGRVKAEDDTPVVGATVSGWSADGPVGVDTSTATDGTFRWRGPMSESTAFVVRAAGRQDVAVEPTLPDPHPSLLSRVDVRMPAERMRISGRVRFPPAFTRPKVDVRLEPAVAAIVREIYGRSEAIVPWRRLELLSDGRFGFAGLVPDVPMRLEIRGEVAPEDHILIPRDAKGGDFEFAPRAEDPKPPPSAAEQSTTGDPKPLTASAEVHGRVVDAEGKGLAGLTVAAASTSAVTDGGGTFQMDLPNTGERRQELRFGWLDGASPAGVEPRAFAPFGKAIVSPGSSEPVSLVLSKSSSVTMRLLDGIDERPLSWARIVIVDGEGDLRFDQAVASRDGVVTIRDLAPGAAGRMSILAPGLRKETSLTLTPGSATDLGDVRLPHGARVRVDVKDASGRPIPGAVVAEVEDEWLKGGAKDVARERDRALRRGVADSGGVCILDGLDSERPLALAVWAPGHAAVGHRVLWTTGPEARLPVTLPRGSTVRMSLTEASGVPISGAVIDLEDARSGAHSLDLWHRALLGGAMGSTEDVVHASQVLWIEDAAKPGSYRIGPVEPGPYELWVERPGYRPLRQKFTVPDDEPEGADSPFTKVKIGSIELRLQLEPEGTPPR